MVGGTSILPEKPVLILFWRNYSYIFSRGISVTLSAINSGLDEENWKWEIAKKRVKLYLNGNLVSNETLLGGFDGTKTGPLIRFSWAPILSSGTYMATIEFTTDAGKTLSYTWQFDLE